MKNFRILQLTALFIFLGTSALFAGGTYLELPNEIRSFYGKKESKPKVFVEGIRLDFDYMRRQMKFVDFVNDPAASDVHIIISQRINGGGGRVYSFMYNNVTYENLSDYTLTCSTTPGDTQEEVREKITETMTLGLMPYANQSELQGKLSVKFNGEEKKEIISAVDPWRNWTFRGDFNGNIDLEESRKSFNYSYRLRGDKVTENWRIRNYASMRVRTREYISNGETYRSENITNYITSSVVKSITSRWSAGTFASYYNSNYRNTVYSISLKPAFEYNIFPWDISDRKVFTIAYYIGPEWKKYYEETIYGKFEESLWEQSLQLDLQLVHTWGEIEAGLDATSFMHDFSKNRITFDSELSVRIVRGFSVNFDFRVQNIHDQIYLPKGDFDLEDILLNNVQLPSTFEVYAGAGIRIQFGSIYNNVVNNRL